MADETLTRVGDYEILGVLGAGGMGKVYKVRNVITDRVEAMKVLLPDLAARRELADRFQREIKTLAALNHPNIAALRTALTWNNQLVMIMEYVEGVSLAARLKQGPLSAAEAVNYMGQVLAALSYAHSLHVIHRDIKPANMMLTPEAVVKLMDFGIARSQGDPSLTATGSTLGSLHYMSPEQVRGERVDERSDLYSVGVSLYELTTGQRPFLAENDYGVMAAQLQEVPPAPISIRGDLPPALNDVIVMAMEKDPARRFQTADAFRTALQSINVATDISVSPSATATSIPAGAATRTSVATPAALASAVKSSSAEIWSSPPSPNAEPVANAPAPANFASAASAASRAPVTALPRHRGRYVAIGGLLVVVLLVAAGIYVPRVRNANAGGGASAASQPHVSTPAPQMTPAQAPLNPAPSGAPAEPPARSESATVAAAPNTEGGTAGTSTHVAEKNTRPKHVAVSPSAADHATVTQASAAPPPSAAPAADPARLQRIEHDLALLGSRAEAVNAGLDSLRQAQSAQGLGLRGDVVASQRRMQTYLAKAQAALRDRDADGAQKYLDLADAEVTALDKFLGR